MPQAAMIRFYQAVPPGVLLICGWLLIALALAWRGLQGLSVPPINGLFILLGLGAYFLPTRLGEPEPGEALKRKLLWLLLAAGVVILCWELIRAFLPPGFA